MPLISGPEQLNEFRTAWTGEKMLELIAEHGGRLRVDWAVGVGKSHNIDDVIETAIRTNRHDTVAVFLPIRQVINERRWVQNPPADIRIANLQPRPEALCGPELNSQWKNFEKNCMGALGRIELCGSCQSNSGCFWPKQYGESLAGVHVIYGTQAHLERSPAFIDQVIQWTGAERVLVILDEVNCVLKTFGRRIRKKNLKMFVDTIKRLNPKKGRRSHGRWIYLSELLLGAPTEDLRCNEWKMPPITLPWSIAVQKKGYSIYGDSFYFPAFDMANFGSSPIDSRERCPNGDIQFASTPRMPVDFIIYSGTAQHEFIEFRLGKGFSAPFADYRFQHPDTRWYNIASPLGAKKYFQGNSPQIFDFFANLIAQRLQEGKRPLLIAKKHFINFCASSMGERLHALGFANIKIITNDWQPDVLANPSAIPLINYGMIGTNLFQEFDCAYCLTSYYTTQEAVDGILQDLLANDFNIPIKISTSGHPCRRTAGANNKCDRVYDIHQYAQSALEHMEMDVVLQAVGRVRPYTHPREIITFQCADHPNLQYTREFKTLAEAREHFGITCCRTNLKNQTIRNIMVAKKEGLKQTEVANKLGICVRTVKRYWNQGKR
jgi:hypothetical protein